MGLIRSKEGSKNKRLSVADKEQKFGQHIIGLMNSEGCNTELLIYQNKKNILVRQSIDTFSVTNSRKKLSLILIASDRKWMLEFLNQSDYTEFVSEFSKNGIKITNMFDNDNTKKNELHNFQLDFKCSESNSSILDKTPNGPSIDMADIDKSKDSESKREKNEILTRLAKIGLPLLPSLHKETEDNILENTYAEEAKHGFTCNENISTFRARNEYTSENNQHIMNNKKTVAPVLKTSTYNPYEHYLDQATNQIQLNNSLITDPFSLIIADNRNTNNELKQYISLMNCKLDSLKNNKEPNENKSLTQFKSKLRAMEMKCENLEDELGRYRSKCNKLDRMNEELTFQLRNIKEIDENTFTDRKETSSQTDPVDKRIELENINYKYQLIKLLKSLPLNSDEFDITQLKCLKDDIVDEELQSHLDKCMQFLQEKPQSNELDNIDEIRKSYIRTTRHIISHMYSTITSSLTRQGDMNQIAEEVRNVTAELVRNFDKLIQNKK
ncbi:hypothetical protein WA026_014433 [Henosepilachna vigintioctopunctata]|uniref:Uncharacterized protein n=1 Tax=Henosepilachna vigintioctopunctata TaxID=420089 RepID=A0AAW1UDL3_9CUCU